MRAALYQGPGDVRIERVRDARIDDPGDVLVAVERAAICGSDLHVYEGREAPDAGTVMGHEFVGRIIESGSAVRQWVVGDRVAAPFTTSCGACFYCRIGLTARCTHGQLFGWLQNGVGLHGGQAELVRVPLADSTLMRVAEGITPEQALLLGDNLATGWHAARMADVTAGTICAVLGCGAVGLMAVVSACELGAARVFAADAIAGRRVLAEGLGATALSPEGDVLLAAVREATDGRGADAVIEAVGSPQATRLAYDLVRPGGVISAVGVHHEGALAFSPGLAYDKNLTYRAGRCPARHLMDSLEPVIRRRGRELEAVFTHTFSLERAPEAYALFARRGEGCIKVALTMAGDDEADSATGGGEA